MTIQQHNQLSLASEIRLETKQTGSGHWDLLGYFETDNGSVAVRVPTTDSQIIDVLNDKDGNHEDQAEEMLQLAISRLLNSGEIIF